MDTGNSRWLIYALAAAVCASMINILGKVGLKGVDPDLATAIRSIVQAAFVAGLCIIVGVWKNFHQLHGNFKAYGSILLCGVAGGLSWIFAFRAIALAQVTKVAPIDKLSLPFGILLAVILLGERPSAWNWLGIFMIALGAYLATWTSR
jgi:bacterial/archaeal transporter family protein